MKPSPKTFWQTTFAFTFIVNLAILIWSISRWTELKVVMYRSIWLIPLVFYLATIGGCIFLFFWIRKGNAARLLDFLELKPLTGVFWQILGLLSFVAVLWAIPTLKFAFRIGEVVKKSTQDPVLTTIVFYWAVWWLVLIAAGGLKLTFKTSWAGGFASALVLLGIAYELYLRFQAVTTYPLSMGWSEASRYYYGSLYFSQSIYGTQIPLSTLHPSRYLLQSLPFLIPGLGLTASRLWQVLLWVGMAGVTAGSLAWRALIPNSQSANGKLGIRELGIAGLFAGWFFLYLLRVGVYYHLEVMVFVPLLFVSAKHPWRSLAAVIFASAWAGISRVNWFPVPAMLAIAIYLLEERTVDGGRWTVNRLPSTVAYLIQPALWTVVGLATAVAAQALYIPLSGNAGNAKAFSSSFFSDLIWERLWPNDSYALGIVLAILIVSGPLLVALAQSVWGRVGQLHWIRSLGLAAILAVLFAGGLVVSVKIGGGGDLHNADAYAVLIGVVAAFFIGDKVRGESKSDWGVVAWPVVATGLLIPLIFLVPALSPNPKFNVKSNQMAFAQLKTLAEQVDGPVLFINERHLLTFHQIDAPLVPEYEVVTLMEMAMSNNQPYLQQFYADLRSQRFAAIVTGKQNVGIKEEGAFANENNIWNTRVSPYILCYYEPLTLIEADESRIEFYTPRAAPGTCP